MLRPSTKWTWTLGLVLAACLATPARSQSTSSAPPEDPDESVREGAVALDEGEPAPFSGQLLAPELAAELATGVEHCLDTKDLEIRREKKICDLRVASETARLEARAQTLRAQLEVVQEALDAQRQRSETPFWERPLFVAGVSFAAGVVVAGALGWASVWAVGQLRPALPPAET